MNIGILGVGSFGEKHLKVLKELNDFNIIGFYDPDEEKSKLIEKKFKIKRYKTTNQLIENCDAVDIVSNTSTHYQLLEIAKSYNKHVFIEKPICSTNIEADQILKNFSNYKPIIQVGHIERYNPTITQELMQLKNIKKIKTKRIGELNKRNQNTALSLDLMIHDIDLILKLCDSEISNISVDKESNRNSISCHIDFQNKIKVHLTAIRQKNIKSQRTIDITCNHQIIQIDLLNKKRTSNIDISNWKPVKEVNQLKNQFLDFNKSIKNKTKAKVDIIDACKSTKIAIKIDNMIKNEIHN